MEVLRSRAHRRINRFRVVESNYRKWVFPTGASDFILKRDHCMAFQMTVDLRGDLSWNFSKGHLMARRWKLLSISASLKPVRGLGLNKLALMAQKCDSRLLQRSILRT